MKKDIKATKYAMFANAFLFIIKIVTGFLYNSIGLISDAFNSLSDVIASFIVYITIKVSHQEPDKEHQYGHARAQPIGALIVAIFTGIVGFEIIISSVIRILEKEQLVKSMIPVYVAIAVIVVKLVLYFYTISVIREQKRKSTALKAILIDHRNDIIATSTVLIGIILANMNNPIFDSVVAFFIGIYIIKSGYEIAKENIKYLMGEAPSEKVFQKIEKLAESIDGVNSVNEIRAHLLGTYIECEVHITVDKNMKIESAHSISHKVRKLIESHEDIQRAYIHVEPDKYRKESKRRF